MMMNQIITRDGMMPIILLGIHNVKNIEDYYSLPMIVDEKMAEVLSCARYDIEDTFKNPYIMFKQMVTISGCDISGLYVYDYNEDDEAADGGKYNAQVRIALPGGHIVGVECHVYDLLMISMMFDIPIYVEDVVIDKVSKLIEKRKNMSSCDNEIADRIKKAKEVEAYKKYLESIKFGKN